MPLKSNIDTKYMNMMGLVHVSLFKYGYFGYHVKFPGEKPRVFFMRNVSKMVQLSVYSQKCVISPDNANGYR